MFCAEGDNAADALKMADFSNRLLMLKPVKVFLRSHLGPLFFMVPTTLIVLILHAFLERVILWRLHKFIKSIMCEFKIPRTSSLDFVENQSYGRVEDSDLLKQSAKNDFLL